MLVMADRATSRLPTCTVTVPAAFETPLTTPVWDAPVESV
jgi:hypothetical protein